MKTINTYTHAYVCIADLCAYKKKHKRTQSTGKNSNMGYTHIAIFLLRAGRDKKRNVHQAA